MPMLAGAAPCDRGSASVQRQKGGVSCMSVNQQTRQDNRSQASNPLGVRLWREAGPWWLLLLTGIAWLIITVVVLRFSIASAATVGLLVGAVFLAAMAGEFLLASVRPNWGWAHALLGVLFLGGAIWAFVNPFGTFWSLAAVVGLLLILQGAFVLITSIESRAFNGVWWLGMVSGILEIVIGFWASQQALPARALLLIIWVGLFAMFRGITDIVFAFELKSAQHR
jgi:uncharacterized membrane protein HdeD (DUF308 family)